MNQLAQLYNNFGNYQYTPLSTGYASWFGQQPTNSPMPGGTGGVSPIGTPTMIGGNYQLGSTTYANPNWLAGLNQAWNTSGGRGLSSMLGLGTLRAGSNFLEGFNAADGGLIGGFGNMLSNFLGNNPTDAVQRQREFDQLVAQESQDMMNRGIDPDTGRPYDTQAEAQARAARNQARGEALGRNALLNRELAGANREAEYRRIVETRGGTEVRR